MSFLLAIALAACTGGETAPPPEPDPLDGNSPLSICLDWCRQCEHASEADQCLKYCADALTDATPLCQIEAGALWACWVEVTSREGCNTNKHIDCWKEDDDIFWCVKRNRGCYFWTGDSGERFCGPLGNPPTCDCTRVCALQDPNVHFQHFRSECTSDFTVSQCECYNNVTLVGTCEEGPVPICDVWASCCNQFFDELYPYSAKL
jgi:hypothetical protein